MKIRAKLVMELLGEGAPPVDKDDDGEPTSVEVGGSEVVMPPGFRRIDPVPQEFGCDAALAYVDSGTKAVAMFIPISSEGLFEPSALGDAIAWERTELDANRGLVEVAIERTSAGVPCYYSIVKSGQEPSGMQYILSIELNLGAGRLRVLGYFDENGTIEVRDATVLELGEGGLVDWTCDPYDPAIIDGLLMNLSEQRKVRRDVPGAPDLRGEGVPEVLPREQLTFSADGLDMAKVSACTNLDVLF